MTDGHIHFEKQPYTLEIIENMVNEAKKHGINEIWLLDHTHKFQEFTFLYEPVEKHPLTAAWYHRKHPDSITDYLKFIEYIRSLSFDISIKFGLEVCYFKDKEDALRQMLTSYPFDFLIGAVHFIDGLGFDLSPEAWTGVDVDHMYQRYYEIMADLIQSGIFTTLAHPDSIKLYGHRPSYDLVPTYRKIAGLLKRYRMSTENNTGLWRYKVADIGLNYDFLRILKEEQVDVHPASDAHEWQYIGRFFDQVNIPCEKKLT